MSKIREIQWSRLGWCYWQCIQRRITTEKRCFVQRRSLVDLVTGRGEVDATMEAMTAANMCHFRGHVRSFGINKNVALRSDGARWSFCRLLQRNRRNSVRGMWRTLKARPMREYLSSIIKGLRLRSEGLSLCSARVIIRPTYKDFGKKTNTSRNCSDRDAPKRGTSRSYLETVRDDALHSLLRMEMAD